MYECFEETVAGQLQKLLELVTLRSLTDLKMAIDMHLIRRHDKKPGDDLVCSKARGVTGVFERHISVQIADNNKRLVLAVMHMPAHESIGDFVRRLVGATRSAGIKNGPFLMDREFHTAAVISTFDDLGEGYFMPCRNTPYVKEKLGKRAAGSLGRVSEAVIRGARATTRHTMIITERKRTGAAAKEKGAKKPPPPAQGAHRICNKQARYRPGLILGPARHRDRIPHDRECPDTRAQQKPRSAPLVLCVFGSRLQRVGHYQCRCGVDDKDTPHKTVTCNAAAPLGCDNQIL